MKKNFKKFWSENNFNRKVLLYMELLGFWLGHTAHSWWVVLVIPLGFLAAFIIDNYIWKKQLN